MDPDIHPFAVLHRKDILSQPPFQGSMLRPLRGFFVFFQSEQVRRVLHPRGFGNEADGPGLGIQLFAYDNGDSRKGEWKLAGCQFSGWRPPPAAYAERVGIDKRRDAIVREKEVM